MGVRDSNVSFQASTNFSNLRERCPYFPRQHIIFPVSLQVLYSRSVQVLASFQVLSDLLDDTGLRLYSLGIFMYTEI